MQPTPFIHGIRLVLINVDAGTVVSDFRADVDGSHPERQMGQSSLSDAVAWTNDTLVYSSRAWLVESAGAILVEQRARTPLRTVSGGITASNEMRLVRLNATTGQITSDIMTDRMRRSALPPFVEVLPVGSQAW